MKFSSGIDSKFIKSLLHILMGRSLIPYIKWNRRIKVKKQHGI